MISFSQFKLNEGKSSPQREYNDILKQMGVMNTDGKIDLQNMNKKIKDFLSIESNKKKFSQEIKENDINGEKIKIKAKKLNPGQTSIYLDQVISRILSNPDFVNDVIKGKIKDRDILISEDNYVIDGHHRWCSAFILNPKCKIKCTRINLPIEIALPILNAILKESGSKDQELSGEDKNNVYKLADSEKLNEKLQKIIDKMAKEDTWKTGLDENELIDKFYKKLYDINKKNPVEYLAKNIEKLPKPMSEFTERKEMPQLKKQEVEKIVKKD